MNEVVEIGVLVNVFGFGETVNARGTTQQQIEWSTLEIQRTTQHNTTQHNTTQHNTTQHNTTQHNTTQHNTTQHNTTQHNITHHNSPPTATSKLVVFQKEAWVAFGGLFINLMGHSCSCVHVFFVRV